MGSARDVVEISSDEEEGVSPVAKRKLPAVSPMACVTKLFADSLMTGKLSAVVMQKKRESDRVGDDDDCVVLDNNPDGDFTVAYKKVVSVGGGSSDELEIVADKGEVACRDFPHSRHSCSNFPFSTTSHMKYCSMCYCFVCDAPAPCTYWGTGLWIDDHCHATDKETKWKALREALRRKSLPASHPENRQNVVHPATTSPRQQDTQCQVSAPQPHPPLIPNINVFPVARQNPLPSVARQNPLPCVARQNPLPSVARHSAVRVTPNAERIVSASVASPVTRDRRGTHNAHSTTAQITRLATSLDLTDRGGAKWFNLPEPYQQEEDEEYDEWEEDDSEDDDWEYADPPEETTLYVGNLHYDIDRERLAQLFEEAGIVEASKVIYSRQTYQSRGFGFVTMRYAEDADKAVKMFHRYEAEGRVLTLSKASRHRGAARVEGSPCQPGSSPFRIYVGNLHLHVDDHMLHELFSDYGRVVDANVVYDNHTAQSRGFGFVAMVTREEMDFTIGVLNAKVFCGRSLRVEIAKEQQQPRRPRR